MPLLGYWSLRGLAQPIRLMLGYAQVDFEEKIYEIGDPPDYSREDWMKDKFALGLDFPNLPYYIDGDVKLTQSKAIMRHLARKHDLLGQSDEEKDRCDQAAEQIGDFRKSFADLCYRSDFKANGPAYIENLPGTLQPFEAFLGDHDWLAGPNLTWADFIMWEMLDQHLLLKPGCLDDFPKLTSYHRRFKDEPKIKKYVESPRFFVGPCNGPMASWGGSFPVAPAAF